MKLDVVNDNKNIQLNNVNNEMESNIIADNYNIQ